MNRTPLVVTFAVGWFLVVAYFVPTAADLPEDAQVAAPMRAVGVVAGLIPTWVTLIGGLALALGAVSLFRIHVGRIARRHPHRVYSVVTLVAMVVTVVVGVAPGETARLTFDWIYESIFVPLRGTMFSLLAFFLASAAYRAFRVRSKEAALMFAAAFVVMLGNVPVAEAIASWLPSWAAWVMDVPMTAAMRGIRIGVGLGVVVLSLRILLGRERSYLGGGS